MDGNSIAQAYGMMVLTAIIIAFAVGGVVAIGLWEGIPWIYHHVSFNFH